MDRSCASHESLGDRLEKYCESHPCTGDVTFLVGSSRELVMAWKLPLLLASEEFERLFKTKWKDYQKFPVSLPELNPDSFRILLKVLYKDSITSNIFANVNLNSETISDLMYMSEVFKLPEIQSCLLSLSSGSEYSLTDRSGYHGYESKPDGMPRLHATNSTNCSTLSEGNHSYSKWLLSLVPILIALLCSGLTKRNASTALSTLTAFIEEKKTFFTLFYRNPRLGFSILASEILRRFLSPLYFGGAVLVTVAVYVIF